MKNLLLLLFIGFFSFSFGQNEGNDISNIQTNQTTQERIEIKSLNVVSIPLPIKGKDEIRGGCMVKLYDIRSYFEYRSNYAYYVDAFSGIHIYMRNNRMDDY